MLATRTVNSLSDRLNRIRDKYEARISQALRAYFRQQAEHAVRLYLQTTKDVAEELVNTGTQEDRRHRSTIYLTLAASLALAYTDAANIASDLLGLHVIQPNDPRLIRLRETALSMVMELDDATIQAIREMLVTGLLRGYSQEQIAYGVTQENFPGIRGVVTEAYKGRAATIARTELARATQQGLMDIYQDNRIAEVYITDGTGCGWTSHDDPDKADGTRRTLIQAQLYPLSHPNCRRLSWPIL